MPAMTPSEIRQFLSAGSRTAKVATVRADGRPHVVPVWFIVDGDDLVFNTGKNSVKGRNLRRDPRVMICVDDDTPPFSMVAIEGEAEVSEDPAALLDIATRIGGRYMGEDRAEEFGRRNGVAGELIVRVRLDRVIALDGISE
jgi:PPOX class probable F420-dependent enzyme